MKHEDLVRALQKPGAVIAAEMTTRKAELWHMASALQGEAGELFDAIKKHVIYNKELDMENVIEELGDIEFYLEGLRQVLVGVESQQLRLLSIEKNIEKLSKRYAAITYSDNAAQARADKQ